MSMAATETETLFYEPGKGHGLAHDPLLSIVAPRPIGWIGSRSAGGINNLAPFSFFNLLSGAPPLLAFCANGPKDSPLNIAETGEFSWNLATRPLADAMNISSGSFAPDVDEFAMAGLTPKSGRMTAAPMVEESPVRFECKVIEIIRLKDLEGATTPGRLVIGQIVGVHIATELIVDGCYDLLRARPLSRAGGRGDYFEAVAEGYLFMPRPAS